MDIQKKRVYAPNPIRKSKSSKKARTTTTVASVPRRLYTTGNAASFGGVGFPKFLNMTHRYTRTIQIAVGSNTVPVHTAFSCIGLFQPFPAVGTSRVMYFAEVSALYARYNVMSAKCKFVITPFSDTLAQQPQRFVGWINQNSTVTPPGFDAIAQYKDAQLRIDNGGINPNTKIIYLNWSTSANNHGSVLGNPELAGTGASNPLESPQFTLTAINMGTTTPTSFYLTAEIEYQVCWHELIEKPAA